MNEESEQIDARLNVSLGADQPLSPRQLDESVLKALSFCKDGRTSLARVDFRMPGKGLKQARFVAHDSNALGQHAFLTAAVTFLGGNGNHPLFKKRIQLKDWYKPAYYRLKASGFSVHFLGVYHYEGNVVFVDFSPETYLQRKMHNSSAFVYVNDLYRAMKDGVAQRIDLHGNVITTIRGNSLEEHLGRFGGSTRRSSNDDLIKVFSDFNSCMPFKKWLSGKVAIAGMRDASWPKWRETEWPGWYLEYKFSGCSGKCGTVSGGMRLGWLRKVA